MAIGPEALIVAGAEAAASVEAAPVVACLAYWPPVDAGEPWWWARRVLAWVRRDASRSLCRGGSAGNETATAPIRLGAVAADVRSSLLLERGEVRRAQF